MSYNFTVENIDEFMNLTAIKNYSTIFPKNIGQMVCEKEIITDDILLFKTHTISNEKINISQNSRVDGLSFNFCIDGKIEYKDNILNKTVGFSQNNSYIKYMDNCNSTISLDKNAQTKALGIVIKNSFLEEKIFKNITNKDEFINQSLNFKLKKENSNNMKLAKELYNSPFIGSLHDIFIQSKVLEIVYNEIINIDKKSSYTEKIKLSTLDKESLYRARDIILSSQDFPDLPTLARKVALNEFKLKYGFRELFNTSPGQMILEQKMLYSKKLLETSEYSVLEISNLVGYKYQQSFSNAFLHFFGTRPKDIIKTRNYYY